MTHCSQHVGVLRVGSFISGRIIVMVILYHNSSFGPTPSSLFEYYVD